MKKLSRTLLVLMILISSITSFTVSAAPGSPNAPGDFKLYMPLVVRNTSVYNVTGSVKDANQNPVPGVSITDKDGHNAVTDVTGHYLITATSGQNALVASKSGYTFLPGVQDVNVSWNTPPLDFNAITACIAGVTDPGFELGGWWVLAGGAAIDTLNKHAGVNSARTGITGGSPNVWGYSYVRSPVISIPVGTTSAILRMWVYTESGEALFLPLPSKPIGSKFTAPITPDRESPDSVNSPASPTLYDAQYVMVLNSSDAILEVVQWDRRDDQSWQPRQFDLSKWAGQNIKIEIGTYNDGEDLTTAMYVDDVSLTMCNDPVPPPPVCSQQVANPSFEYFGNWMDNSTALFPYPSAYVSTFANSGFHSLRLGIPYDDVNGVNAYGWSEAYQIVTVPAGTTYARFSFWILPRSEEPYTYVTQPDSTDGAESPQSPSGPDRQYVRIMDAAGAVLLQQLVYEGGSNMNSLIWKPKAYDLTAYAGQTIRIVFGVYNDGLGGRTNMYIDDVYLDTCTGVLPPPPPPPPSICEDEIFNGGFEWNSDWYIPATAYSAGYTSYLSHTGARAMRTGIYYPSQNRYSYSDFGQYVYIPFDASSAVLNYYEFSLGGDWGNDVQYLLVLDIWGNWIDTLLWQSNGNAFWKSRSVDLTAYAGWVIRLQWGTYNNGWGAVTSMTVDDVSLLACP